MSLSEWTRSWTHQLQVRRHQPSASRDTQGCALQTQRLPFAKLLSFVLQIDFLAVFVKAANGGPPGAVLVSMVTNGFFLKGGEGPGGGDC